MTNFEAALKIIENSKGITETQLMANKAAYIANRIAFNRFWLIASIVVIATLVVLCILSAKSGGEFHDAYDGLFVATAITCGAGFLVILFSAIALNGWVSDPAQSYADYILQMAANCL